MRKSVARLVTAFTLVFMVLQLSLVAFAAPNIPAATSDFYVNDFAGIFSEEEKTQLMDNAVALSDEHNGIQVVITTVESLGGYTVEEYAIQMYNQYEIGKDDMGLLVLLSTGDRQIRVEVGKAMEAYINDSKAGRFIDKYAIPALKENNFSEGLISLQKAFIDEIVATDKSTESAAETLPDESKATPNVFANLDVILIVCAVIASIAVIILMIRKSIRKNAEKQQRIEDLTAQLASSQKETAQVSFQARKEAAELREKIQSLSSEKSRLEAQYGTLTDRYQRVQRLYPTADSDVTAMIDEEIRQKDMALAKQVDDLIQGVIGLRASKDIVHQLDEVRARYANLSQKQKKYVQSNIPGLNRLYDESLQLKRQYEKEVEEARRKKAATLAVASVTAIISGLSVGRSRDLRQLKEAKRIYDSLDAGSRSYFDKSVAEQLDQLYRQAKHAQEQEEAEERRRREEERRRKQREEDERRRRMQSSSSSFGGSSHHGGFGGHSGGGGSSRGF